MTTVALAVPRRVAFRQLSLLLGCEAIVGHGFRAECGCGWHGPTQKTMRAAREDARLHNTTGGAHNDE